RVAWRFHAAGEALTVRSRRSADLRRLGTRNRGADKMRPGALFKRRPADGHAVFGGDPSATGSPKTAERSGANSALSARVSWSTSFLNSIKVCPEDRP